MVVGGCCNCPAPPPLWLDGLVKSDSDERSVCLKFNILQLEVTGKKTLSVWVWNRPSAPRYPPGILKTRHSHWKQLEKYANQRWTHGLIALLSYFLWKVMHYVTFALLLCYSFLSGLGCLFVCFFFCLFLFITTKKVIFLANVKAL